MQRLEILNYSESDIRSMIDSNPDYKVGIKLMAMLQIKRGMSTRQLQQFYYTSHSRYAIWHKAFIKYGIEGLKEKTRPGRPPRLLKEQLDKLKEVLLNESPEDFGYNTATWTGPIIIDWIKKHYSVAYKKAQIYNILKKHLGLSYQKGKGFYPEADPEKRKEFISLLKKTSGKS